MLRLELQTAGRQFRRQFGAAIRQNLIRALTELITNSDDSYSRMAPDHQPEKGRIDITYDRRNRLIAVTDWAEGMDSQDMERMYPQYGASTSGLLDNQAVRGYFGKGLKDVLFSMEDGKVESIKNGKYYKASFIWTDDREDSHSDDGTGFQKNGSLYGQPTILIDELAEEATPALRRKLGIPSGNGTRVSFKIPESISLPRHESMLRNLSNYSLLRLINANPRRRILLRTHNANNRRVENQIQYRFPNGELILEDQFEIQVRAQADNPSPDGSGQVFGIKMKVYRADSPLTQSGDDREGGLLIYDEYGTVLDLTLFDYDRDEFAAHLYGMLEVQGFRDLLKAEEDVLTDTRDGLVPRHPFSQTLANEIETRLRPFVERERHLQLLNTPRILPEGQRKRLVESVNHINMLLSNLSGFDITAVDVGDESLQIPPEGGIGFSPQTLRLQQNSQGIVRLKIDTSIIPPGSLVQLNVSNPKVSVSPEAFEVVAIPGQLVSIEQIIVYSRRAGIKATIEATAGSLQDQMTVQIVAGDYPTPPNGMNFLPGVLRLGDNSRRSASLYVHKSVASPGDVIELKVDEQNGSNLEMNVNKVVLQSDDFRKSVARIKVPVKGTGIGGRGTVVARVNGNQAALEVNVVSKQNLNRSSPLVITGYRFDQTTPSNARASYDDETGIIWIYLKNPIVERYFGNLPLPVALNTPHCQILLAEIVLEQVAWVARRKMIEAGTAMYIGNNHTEEDLAAVRKFMNEYGDKIHSWITDDQVIAQVIEVMTERLRV